MVRGLNPDTVITDEVSMSAFSKQVGGGHYTKMKIQPFQYSMANGLDPMQHTIIKYVTRFRDKNGVEDLKKAIHTIELLIEHEETKNEKPLNRAAAKPSKRNNPTLFGMPLPTDVSHALCADVEVSCLEGTPAGWSDERRERVNQVVRRQCKLLAEMYRGESTVYILDRKYERAQNLAHSMGWPRWVYIPADRCLETFRGCRESIIVVPNGVTLTPEQRVILASGRNVVFLLG